MKNPVPKKNQKIKKNKRTKKVSRVRSLMGAEPLRSGNQHLERWMPLFPARKFCSLRYATSVGITGTTGAVGSHVFAANGLYDPDITSTGHQPLGFDQMMLSYNHFCVLKSRIFVTFKNDTNTTPTCIVGVHAESTPVTTPERLMEFGLLNSTVLEFKAVSGSTKSVEARTDIAKFQGVVNAVDDPELHGSVAANPAELTYWHVQLWDTGGGTATVRADVVIEYDAWFLEPRELTQSLQVMRSEFNSRLIKQLQKLEVEAKVPH